MGRSEIFYSNQQEGRFREWRARLGLSLLCHLAGLARELSAKIWRSLLVVVLIGHDTRAWQSEHKHNIQRQLAHDHSISSRHYTVSTFCFEQLISRIKRSVVPRSHYLRCTPPSTVPSFNQYSQFQQK